MITSPGRFPLTGLPQSDSCPLVYIPELEGYVPVHSANLMTSKSGLSAAGSAAYIGRSEVAEERGRVAAVVAAGYLGLPQAYELDKIQANRLPAIGSAQRESIPLSSGVQAAARKWPTFGYGT
jgi:hypothetical protein